MRFSRWVEHTFQAITAFLMVAMVVLTLLQVASRYAFEFSLPWTEELARLDLIYLTFFGSVVAFQRREHLKVEVLVHALPPGIRRWLAVLIDLAAIGVLTVVVWQGIPLLAKFWPVLSAALEWPTTIFYFPVVFGCLVLLVYTALDVIAVIREIAPTKDPVPPRGAAV
ncbi:MAG TPA: TRAP transporter small permease [Candidatus Acidoferrum sp.]|nr:TRAP transporter small permease [Candidatus Acidoferrum sp.]